MSSYRHVLHAVFPYLFQLPQGSSHCASSPLVKLVPVFREIPGVRFTINILFIPNVLRLN